MTFGSLSKISRQYLADAVGPTASFTPHLASGGTWKAALYGNAGTPDATVAASLFAYNAGQWVSGNEVTDATNWVAGGRPLAWASATRFSSASNLVTFDADDTPGGGTVTITNAAGDLVYDDSLTTPVAKQGLAYHSFGGLQSITAGTFTIIWNAAGVMQTAV